jgi:hypothetical protein
MCTLAVALHADRRWPIVVAANRDERLGRPAETWALRGGVAPPAGGGAPRPPRHAAPRDVEAGGTWIGVSQAGVFAALTNFHAGVPPDRSRRSRGELVPLALAAPSAAAAREALAAVPAAGFNPFHLVVADAQDAFLWRFDGGSDAVTPLGPGLHVVTERTPDGRDPRGELVRARWPLDPSPPRLAELLGLHGPGPAESVCVHAGEAYGSRSSAILRLAPSLARSDLYVADGPPCRAPFEDRSELLLALARSEG